MENQMIRQEHKMWDAAVRGDTAAFKELVASDAVMICGGYRCTGIEYAEYIKDFAIRNYSIRNMEIIYSADSETLLHYIIHIEAENESSKDLEGIFHVASLWKKHLEKWVLCFNMDSRINGDEPCLSR